MYMCPQCKTLRMASPQTQAKQRPMYECPRLPCFAHVALPPQAAASCSFRTSKDFPARAQEVLQLVQMPEPHACMVSVSLWHAELSLARLRLR